MDPPYRNMMATTDFSYMWAKGRYDKWTSVLLIYEMILEKNRRLMN
jgi:hypothetical protein